MSQPAPNPPRPTRGRTCLACDRRDDADPARPACRETGLPLAEQVRAAVCPLGRWREGMGDTVARVLDATGVGPVAKAVIQGVTGKPCGCGSRQIRLNQLVPYAPAP